jgi:hypothetical protein
MSDHLDLVGNPSHADLEPGESAGCLAVDRREVRSTKKRDAPSSPTADRY